MNITDAIAELRLLQHSLAPASHEDHAVLHDALETVLTECTLLEAADEANDD